MEFLKKESKNVYVNNSAQLTTLDFIYWLSYLNEKNIKRMNEDFFVQMFVCRALVFDIVPLTTEVEYWWTTINKMKF